MKESACRASPACMESRSLMIVRLTRGASLIDARNASACSSCVMAHELPLMRAYAIPLSCRRSLASSFYRAFRGYFSLRPPSFCLKQLDPCVRVESPSACTLKGGRSSKSKIQRSLSSSHECIEWWTKKMEQMEKPVVKELVKKLSYSNLLGLDEKLKNGSFKEGSLNGELLRVKTKFPREVLLCRVGEFYEAVGFDACILVQYASLNPMSGLRSDMVPRAGCPVMNLRQTLDALTSSGFSVCVYEEMRGPFQGRQRKDRFVSGHAHPGSPYVYGLAEGNIDLDLTDEVFVIGISRAATGYRLIFVSEMMRTFSVEEGLTEEAAVARLRTKTCFHFFLHRSLRDDFSGLFNWREYGEGGMLWAECQGKSVEWFDHDPVSQVISKVKELYSLDTAEEFREVVCDLKGRPKPLNVGTATQLGIIPTVGVPSLVKVLLPKDSTGLCCTYMRDLLLNPPRAQIARSIQDACKLMAQVTCAIPEFTCISAAKLVKLISSKEANHLELSRLRNLAEDVIALRKDQQLSLILEQLIVPTSSATGLKTDCETLVSDCIDIVDKIDSVLAAEDDPGQHFTSVPHIPDEFFQTMECSWRGRVKRDLADDFYEEVQNAAQQLSTAVETDFLPILMHLRASDVLITTASKPEVIFSRDNDAVWLRLRNLPTNMLKQFSALLPAQDARGKRSKEGLYSTMSVESALQRYRNAALNASCRIYDILRSLAEALKANLNSIVFASVLATIAKTLFAHVSEARRRNWSFPKILDEEAKHKMTPENSIDDENKAEVPSRKDELLLENLIPYWIDTTHSLVVSNTVKMSSLLLLSGPNGGGKSSILRSIGAAALLGICGLMVPASSGVIPRFDALMLRMMPQDSPADGKSSFQMEMSELRAILCEVTSSSLVLVDEICRGTEVQKGTAIAASVIEFLDSVRCLGVLSTHLHGLLDMKLDVERLVYKAMGTTNVDGVLKPTWKMNDGCCRESLAFETARSEGVPEFVLERAGQLYKMYYTSEQIPSQSRSLVSGYFAWAGPLNEGAALKNEGGEDNNNENNGQVASSGLLSKISVIEGLEGTTSFEDDKVRYISQSYEMSGINGKANNSAAGVFEELCRQKLSEMHKRYSSHYSFENMDLVFTSVGDREQPPPGATGCSCVYLMLRPDGRYYIGQTDNIDGRIRAHRARPGLKRVPFMYVQVSSKSLASELETLLINELPSYGIVLVNKCDQFHRHFGAKVAAASQLPF